MKVAVLLPHRIDPASRSRAAGVARALEAAAQRRQSVDRIVLGVPDDTRRDAGVEDGLQVREFRVRAIDAERIRTLEAIGGWPPRTFPDRGIFFRDGIADFADCDVWLLLAATGVDDEGEVESVLRLRPSLVLGPETPATDDDTAWSDILERLSELHGG